MTTDTLTRTRNASEGEPAGLTPPPPEPITATSAELWAYSNVAARLEHFARVAAATFHAIRAGGLLDNLPADESEQADHMAGTELLANLEREVIRLEMENEREPVTDVSIFLGALSSKAERAERGG